MRRVFLADAARRIAAQRHDVAHARLPIGADHAVDLIARRADASEMRGRRQRGLGEDALHRRVRALARRAARAVRDRDEIRPQGAKPLDRVPQRALHLVGLRREELERDVDARMPTWRLARTKSPTITQLLARTTRARGADRARATATRQSFRPSSGSGGSTRCSATSRPAALIHCATVSGAKPRRRCACSSRRNSRSCGAKSTTSSRPCGRSVRAASAIARAPSSRKCST